jgi:hypothetical protein
MKALAAALSRRSLVTVAAVAAAAVAAARLARPEEDASPEVPRTGKNSSSWGYRLTKHIEQYYRTTRV